MTVTDVWQRVRSHYTEAVLYPFLTFSFLVIYVAAHTMNVFMVLLAVPLLWNLRSLRLYGVVFGLIGILYLWAVLRSELLSLLLQGVAFPEAYERAGEFVHAPPLMIMACYTVILAASNLTEAASLRVFKWYAWVLLSASTVLFFDCLSRGGMLVWLLENVFGGRTERAYIKLSNGNLMMLMVFWPLVMAARQGNRNWLVFIPAVSIVAVAFSSDTNLQLIALVASTAVFWAARYWPELWSQKGLTPQLGLAALSAFGVLVFPALVALGHYSGLFDRLHDNVPASWAARLDIWRFSLERWLERPLLGWGYEGSRQFMPIIPDHPHNMSMQAVLELGLPGLLLLAALWFIIPCRLKGGAADKVDGSAPDVDAYALPYALATITAIYVIYTAGFGLWRSWVFSGAALAVFVFILARRSAGHDMTVRAEQFRQLGF